MTQAIFDPGSRIPILRHGPRSGLPAGNPTSKEEHADMPRNYRREHGRTSELNDHVGEMTKIMDRKREEEAARTARGDHDVQMNDANALAEGPITAVPATTPLPDSGIICGEERTPLVGLHGDTQNSDVTAEKDWHCHGCEEWRKPNQIRCQCGRCAHLKMMTYSNAEGVVHTAREWADHEKNDDRDEISSAATDDARPTPVAVGLSTQREMTRFQLWADERDDLQNAPVEPGDNRPDIRTDMTRQLKGEIDTNKTTQQTLSKTIVQPTHHDIQGVTDYVKANLTGDEAKTDFETWGQGFRLWRSNVNVTEYDTLEADQILHLAIQRELISEEDEGEQEADAMKDEN
jgi:hypothetical protein